MKFYTLFLVFSNIFALTYSVPVEECKKLKNLIDVEKVKNYGDDCCKNDKVECDESQNHIIKL